MIDAKKSKHESMKIIFYNMICRIYNKYIQEVVLAKNMYVIFVCVAFHGLSRFCQQQPTTVTMLEKSRLISSQFPPHPLSSPL